jgi:hypothetical protein
VGDNKRKEAPAKTFHHSVYVILLDPAVLQHRSILPLNPHRDPAKPCVYVGMTGLAVQDRFQNQGSGSDGKGFARRSATGRLHCRRRRLGLGDFLGSDAVGA